MICEEYWPPIGETKVFGTIEVKHIKQDAHGKEIIKRSFTVSKVAYIFYINIINFHVDWYT